MKRPNEYSVAQTTGVAVRSRPNPPIAEPPVPSLRSLGLHDLPPELLHAIARYIRPDWPYLSRPYEAHPAHFPIGPELRALLRWGASCKTASALIDAIFHAEENFGLSKLASSAAWEFGSHAPDIRQSLSKRYGYDPSGSSAPDHSSVNVVDNEAELEECLTKIAAGTPRLERLDLQLRLDAGSEAGIARVATQLEQCTALKVLSLKLSRPFPGCWLNALRGMQALLSLEIKAGSLAEDMPGRLATLPSATTLESLEIEATQLTPDFVNSLATHAARWQRLRFLSLHGLRLEPSTCEALILACSAFPKIELLELHTSEPAQNLSGLVCELRKKTRISRLGLHPLPAATQERKDLFEQLRLYAQLKELRCTGLLDADCVACIVALLQASDTNLHSLDLDARMLDEAGMIALAQGVKASEVLRELRLSRHGFSVEGAKALADAIVTSPALLALTLDHCEIEPELQGKALGGALQASTRLREFHWRKSHGAHFDLAISQVARRFAIAAAQSTSLLHMTLGSQVGWKFRAANEQLAKNRRSLEAGVPCDRPGSHPKAD